MAAVDATLLYLDYITNMKTDERNNNNNNNNNSTSLRPYTNEAQFIMLDSMRVRMYKGHVYPAKQTFTETCSHRPSFG